MDASLSYGLISLVPVVVVITMALVTKRTLESLIVGSLVGFIILKGTGFLSAWIATAQEVFGESAWFIWVFGVFGMVKCFLKNLGEPKGYLNWAQNSQKLEVRLY